jgi:hypothetical protein
VTNPGPTPLTRLHVASRVAASLIGGYVFVWGFTSLGIGALVAAGMAFDEARTLLQLLAFLVFLAAFCWAFAAAGLGRVWAVLAGGGAAMSAAACALSRALS